jgi:hypothetical protein
VYKSEGTYYRVRLPNSLWLRWRIGLFAVVELAFYFWIFYAGVMYVLAAGDPGSLVQAGCAIIFIAEVDKIFFEAYIRSEDREIMDKLFYEYPFSDEDKNIIHEKMNAVRKEMVLFQRLVGDDADAERLLAAALDRARHRVVVKRPLAAPPLQGRAPDFSLKGKSTRFDVYALRRIS